MQTMSGRKLIPGYYIFLGGNFVIWRIKKQGVVAQSNAEAEFQAMTHDVCGMLQMQILLNDLRIEYEGPMKLLGQKINYQYCS